LSQWFGHCTAIVQDKQYEYDQALEEGQTPEYTAQELEDLYAALEYMKEVSKPLRKLSNV
jgi:hypothetical protein